MEIKERLLFYKQMQRDYRIALFIPSSIRSSTRFGFCNYLNCRSVSFLHIDDLPELLATKPKQQYNCLYWFKANKLRPRLMCINAAISACEIEINKMSVE